MIHVQREGVGSIIMHASFLHCNTRTNISNVISWDFHTYTCIVFTISNGLIIHTSYLYLTSFIPSIKIRRKFLSFSHIPGRNIMIHHHLPCHKVLLNRFRAQPYKCAMQSQLTQRERVITLVPTTYK